MRTAAAFSVALLVATSVACDSPSDPARNLQLRLEVSPDPAVVGQPVDFLVFIKNTGSESLTVSDKTTEIRSLENGSVLMRTGVYGSVAVPPRSEQGPDRFRYTFRSVGEFEFVRYYAEPELILKDTVTVGSD